MTRDEAIAIVDLKREEAIVTILALAEKAERYDRLSGQVSPTTPSGMTPVYLKPSHKKRKTPLRQGQRTSGSGPSTAIPNRPVSRTYPKSLPGLSNLFGKASGHLPSVYRRSSTGSLYGDRAYDLSLLVLSV
jgi:hypothetical protein